jgi:hypothetical protein
MGNIHSGGDAPAPGGCPIKHAEPQAGGQTQGCPIKHADSSAARNRGVVYNVYAQPIDPTNNMPSNANQSPAPGQREDLSTTRVQSTIPKGGTEATWLYPSPQVRNVCRGPNSVAPVFTYAVSLPCCTHACSQMFYNALVRKGKAEDVQEKASTGE